jgi:hypothetical protein
MGNIMSKEKNYFIVNMASYTSPSVSEKPNKDWVEYGDDNNYFQYLIDLYYGSPTNNACIKGKADMIYGHGPEVIRGDRHLKGYLDFKILFSDDQVKKVVMDLTMLGMGAFQLVKSKDGKKYVKAYHFPIQTLRPQKANEKGEIEKWYYCADWSKLKRNEKPKEFCAFGYDDSDKECMYVIRPYSTGAFYFSPPDYQGGTQYCELEGEISNYHINGIRNGLAPSMLINFNNGEPPEETKDAIESQINAKFGGSSNTGRAIISFNDSKEQAADITPVQLSDAAQQYQFLSTECVDKILLSHRITSPLIFGIKNTGNGFSSNSEELKTATILFDNLVIRPFQNILVNAFNQVLLYNGYMVDIYFKTLQPLEFIDLSGKALDSATKEKEMGLSLSAGEKISFDYDDTLSTARGQQLAKKEIDNGSTVYIVSARDNKEAMYEVADKLGIDHSKIYATGSNSAKVQKIQELGIDKHYDNNSDVVNALDPIGVQFADMSEADENDWLLHLEDKGEIVDMNEWEIIDVREATEEDNLLEFAYDNPELKSKDDKGIFKIRYRYGPEANSNNSRKFCVDMVALTKQGIVYRREDINQMSFSGVNGQFAPAGRSTYSIWRFKGGVNCHHAWYRVTYMRKTIKGAFKPLTSKEKGSDIREMDNYNPVSNAKANTEGVPFSPPNWKDAKTKPIDMPNKGSLKNK